MNVDYFRTAKKSYMIVRKAGYPFEEYELKMIMNNDIFCLLQFQIIIADEGVEYWYDVTGMQSLKQQFSLVSVGEKQLQVVLQNLVDMKAAMEEYLLDDANIDFSTSMIYYDRFTGKVRFCYVPGLGKQNISSLKILFEEILQRLNHADPVAVQVGYEMYEKCAQSDFMLEDYIKFLDTCAKKGKQTEEEEFPDEEKAEAAPAPTEKREPVPAAKEEEADVPPGDDGLEMLLQETERKAGHRKQRKKEKKRRFSYRKAINEERERLYVAESIPEDRFTECISDEDMVNSWKLVYRGDGLESDIPLTDFPFLIGSDTQQAQGVLEARTVSRLHARFMLVDEKLYIEDFNSTNGTYLNHKLIPMNTPMELHEGDRIVFATEEYALFCKRVPAGRVGAEK